MRTPLAEVRPPGIYSEAAEKRHTPIQLGKSGIVGFVGLAERGPTDTPVRITSAVQFYTIFGDLSEGGFLAPSVEAFFRNGGKECFVVRVVHHTGRSFGEYAAHAGARLNDRDGNGLLSIVAQSEGEWGNKVSVSLVAQAPRAQTFLTLDASEGDSWITVRSTHGIRPGTLLKICDGNGDIYRYVEEVSGKTIGWSGGEPLPRDLKVHAPTYVETVEFMLTVASPYGREVYSDLSLHPGSPSNIARVVSERSVLISAEILPIRSEAPGHLPSEAVDVPLKGGLDGLLNVTPDDFIGMSRGPGDLTGLAAFELVEDVDLLAIPDIHWLFQRNQGRDGMPFSTLKDVEVVQDSMISQCERLADRFAILDSPFPYSADRTREYRLLFDTRFAAIYFPWVVSSHRGERLVLPPCGHIAGIFARCDAAMGVNRPPANETIEGADDLSVLLRDEDVGFMNGEGINCLKANGPRGLRVWGARTMSSDPQHRYTNVRRILNAITKAMSQNLLWVVFEPNVPSLWKVVTRNVTSFMSDLWKRGFFSGRTPEESFYIKCDDETNPPEERDAGRLVVEVGVAPVRPAEFMVLRLAQEMHENPEG